MTVFEYAEAAVCLAGLAWGGLAATHSVTTEYSKQFGKELASCNLTTAIRRWPSHFVELFDSIFGRHHWDWFCFRRSSYFSFGGYAVVTFTYCVLSATPFGQLSEGKSVGTFISALVVCTLFNSLPDYFSLLETRWLINRLGRNPSFKAFLGAAILDLFLTTTIFFGFISSWFVFVELIVSPS